MENGVPPVQVRIQDPWYVRETVTRLWDGTVCLLTYGLALHLVQPAQAASQIWVGGLSVLLFYVVAEVAGLYRNWRGIPVRQEIFCAWWTWAFSLLALGGLGLATGWTGFLHRQTLLVWAGAGAGLLGAGRLGIRAIRQLLRRFGYNIRSFAVVGVNRLGFQLAQSIQQAPELGLRFLGFYDDRAPRRTPCIPPELGSRIGTIDQLVEHARQGQVEVIYITLPLRAEARIRSILDRLSDTTASVYLVPDFFAFQLLHSRWTTINGLPVVSVFENPFYGVDGLVKRGMDLLLGTFFLLLAAVPMLLIALAIKLTSPGPVFFRQRRYGLDGREIRVWKFRTMYVCEDGPNIPQAKPGDPRITPIGRFLRRTSLDELPQLFNVLEGTMSLVGPRPHATAHNELYRKKIQGYMLRHKVKPGITGLAQVEGYRGETDSLEKMQKRIEYDHKYIREWSLWLDLKILARTVRAVLSRQNAY
jgi:putative colanic acid biosynthesis UDP-glucose lipid carrier transferase